MKGKPRGSGREKGKGRDKYGLRPGQLAAMLIDDKAEVLRMHVRKIGLANLKEYGTLMTLLKKLRLFDQQLPSELFHWWVANLPNSPVELAILRQQDKGYEILLARRLPDDKEFPGEPWHLPGSVILPGQTIEQKLQAILNREVASATVTTPQFVTIYQHVVPGSYRQHEICLLHACLLQGEWNEAMSAKTRARFFPLNQIPENTIAIHQDYMVILRNWLRLKKGLWNVP